MKALKIILSLWVLIHPSVATASSCRAVVRQKVVVQEVVQPVAVATVFTPIAVAVPAYGAGYQAESEEVKAMREELRLLRLEIQSLAQSRVQAQPEPPPVRAQVQVPAHVQAMLDMGCVKCHEKDAAAKKGGGLTLFEGNVPVKLTCEQSFKVLKAVRDGTMPKGGKPATDAQYGVLIHGLIDDQVK